MSGLDELFQEGTSKEFQDVMQGILPESRVVITQGEVVDKRVNVLTEWKTADGGRIGEMGFVFSPTEVHVEGLLLMVDYQKTGIQTRLQKEFLPWCVDMGLVRLTFASMPGTEGHKRLRKAGYHEFGDGLQGTYTQRDKVQQYVEWVENGRPPGAEPFWHAVKEGIDVRHDTDS